MDRELTRYTIEGAPGYEAYKDPDGEWVRYEDMQWRTDRPLEGDNIIIHIERYGPNFMCIGHVDDNGNVCDTDGDPLGYYTEDITRWLPLDVLPKV